MFIAYSVLVFRRPPFHHNILLCFYLIPKSSDLAGLNTEKRFSEFIPTHPEMIRRRFQRVIKKPVNITIIASPTP